MTTRPDWTAHDPRRYQAHPLYQEPDAPAYAIPEPKRTPRWELALFVGGVLAVLLAVAVAAWK